MAKQYVIIVDLLLVTLFAGIGRASHSESLTPVAVLRTAAPFLVALLVGWAVLLVRKREAMGWSAGLFLSICTVAGGMALRRTQGDGTAVAFVIVASIVVTAFLLGWRLLHRGVTARRHPAAD